jgi:hypothetical protein
MTRIRIIIDADINDDFDPDAITNPDDPFVEPISARRQLAADVQYLLNDAPEAAMVGLTIGHTSDVRIDVVTHAGR